MILAQQVQCTVGWSDFEENTLHDVHNECRTPIPKFHFYLFISYLSSVSLTIRAIIILLVFLLFSCISFNLTCQLSLSLHHSFLLSFLLLSFLLFLFPNFALSVSLYVSLLTRHLFSCLPLYCSNILFSVYLCLPFLSTSFALSCHLPSWGFISIFLLFLSIYPFSIGCKEHAL